MVPRRLGCHLNPYFSISQSFCLSIPNNLISHNWVCFSSDFCSSLPLCRPRHISYRNCNIKTCTDQQNFTKIVTLLFKFCLHLWFLYFSFSLYTLLSYPFFSFFHSLSLSLFNLTTTSKIDIWDSRALGITKWVWFDHAKLTVQTDAWLSFEQWWCQWIDCQFFYNTFTWDEGSIQTHDLLIVSPMSYPLRFVKIVWDRQRSVVVYS